MVKYSKGVVFVKKKMTLAVEILCLVCLIGGALFIHFKGEDEVSFSGTLMYKYNKELVFTDGDTEKVAPLDLSVVPEKDNYARNMCFFGSKSKILLERICGKIELYNVDTNEYTQVYQVENPVVKIHEFDYVDDEHFSIIENNKLLLVNIVTNEKIVIADDAVEYSSVSWTASGKNVYYICEDDTDIRGSVCRLNIHTGKKEKFCFANKVACSPDGRYFAYTTYEVHRLFGRVAIEGIFDSHFKVYVQDILTGDKWEFDIPAYDYSFSPDGEKLLISCDSREIGSTSGKALRVWDFKNDKSQIILPEIPLIHDVDWIE